MFTNHDVYLYILSIQPQFHLQMYTNMVVVNLFLLLVCSLLACYSESFPLCTNSRAPSELKAPLRFCQYNGSACCDPTEDFNLQKLFEALNISDPQCASLMRSILCAKCDPYSAQLFGIDAGLRNTPILCNSTTFDFCTKVWDACGKISMYSSPFFPPGQGTVVIPSNRSPSKLIDGWKSKHEFCEAFGGSPDDTTVCFGGKSAVFANSRNQAPSKGICTEKIANGSYVSMVTHPDGSDHVFLSSQEGKIWLAGIPTAGSQGILRIDESKPFLDISDKVLFQTRYGLFGTVFHPDFTKNGRFFVSFNCDKLQHVGCSGRCSCNQDAKCDPANLPTESGVLPCQIHNVIAEYGVNHIAFKPSNAETADPKEVRRILTMGLPSHKGHAGQLLFGPTDGFMYVVVPFEAKDYDKYHFVQNKRSMLGKVLRIDVNKIPSETEADGENMWGNYSIPEDNPYMDDKELLPEIWALGLRNPWRCSFDAKRPSYFMCGDSGQDLYQEVDIVTKGGNFGWPIYEGHSLTHVGESQGANLPPSSINPIFPILEYNRFDAGVASASFITGGFFYRSASDPCLYGRYLYADLYANVVWVATEFPENSGNFTSKKIHFTCAKDSPLVCNKIPGSNDAAIGYMFSFGEDNRRDIYILASTGVYRIVHPSRCNFSCSQEKQSGFASQKPRSSSSYRRKLLLFDSLLCWFVAFSGFYIAVSL